MTAHLLDDKLNLHGLIMAHRKFEGNQTADKIEHFIKAELHDLRVNKEKVLAITCDSGSNVKAAASRISVRISCVCHNINLIVKNGFQLFASK